MTFTQRQIVERAYECLTRGHSPECSCVLCEGIRLADKLEAENALLKQEHAEMGQAVDVISKSACPMCMVADHTLAEHERMADERGPMPPSVMAMLREENERLREAATEAVAMLDKFRLWSKQGCNWPATGIEAETLDAQITKLRAALGKDTP